MRIGYRTPTQLGLLERFHQTLKTEEVYWKLYASPGEARESLEVFRRRYNEVRPHWALVPPEGGDPVTPANVYVHGQPARPTEVAGLGQGGAGEVECDHRRRALPVCGRARRGGGMSSTNSAHRGIRGRTSPPLAHRPASITGVRRRGQGVDNSGCARFSTHRNRSWACPVDFGAKTVLIIS